MFYKIGVIGAGAMGTAISQTISLNNHEVLMYARKKEVCNNINSMGYNTHYYPNILLNNNIHAVNSLSELNDVDAVFICIPSSIVREIARELKGIVKPDCIFVNTAKGLEKDTNKRMSEVIEEEIGRPVVVLSGPNIAAEMAQNYFTATTIACENDDYLNAVKDILESKIFKVNANNDVIGTEFSGIIKNVLAISQGICEGMEINDNARFAVFTKSYAETKDIIERLGGNRDTVDDYCGFGDIITASTLNVSRNHTLGVLYGQRIVIDEKASGVLFEGKNTTRILKKLCDDLNYDCDTVNFVYDVIINKNNPKISFEEFWKKL
ncbi:NAD(P)H-dependent glycerol-3-phosphate dehydrogenase [Methanobrevibacter sp.]|uniref:NAD(P)H-dependent glycerol-3-phosphate dehydrogenase n=1 Tax=Methanobrevibacter sp. TaxID=66852 RepID=UPI00388E5C0E